MFLNLHMYHLNTTLREKEFSWIGLKLIFSAELVLENFIVDETNQPEDEDKNEEKYRIDLPHKDLVKMNFPVSLFLCPRLGLGGRSLSESVYVGLHQGVDEGFEETEDQPAVDHLDVGGGGEVGAHTCI